MSKVDLEYYGVRIVNCRNHDPQVEYNQLKQRKLATSRMADDRSSKTAIRVFLFVLTERENLTDEAWDTIQEKCDSIIFGHAKIRRSAIKNVSSYQCQVTDMNEADTQTGVMYRLILTSYHRYSDLLREISESKHVLEEHAKRQISTTSLFELDKKGKIESDDGDILFQAAQFS